MLLTYLVALAGAILLWRLRRRVSRLEREIQHLRQMLATVPPAIGQSADPQLPVGAALPRPPLPPQAEPGPMPDAMPPGAAASSIVPGTAALRPERAVASAAAQPAAAVGPVAFDPVVSFIRANPFASAGIGLILLGVGFLFSYLAVAGLMPPALRVVSIAVVAAAMFAVGVHQQRRRAAFGENLQGGGLAVAYLSVLWAYQGYGLLSAGAAFGFLTTLSAAAFGWGALRGQALFGFVGLIGALLAPVFASAGGVFTGLAAYALGIAVMSTGLAWRLARPELAACAATGACVLLGVAAIEQLVPGDAMHAWASTAGHMALFAGYGLWTTRATAPGYRLAAAASSLVLAPLLGVLIAGYGAKASDAALAVLLALTALAYLAHAWRTAGAASALIGGLGAAFGAAALGIGLEGPTQALSLAAGSFVMALMAAERRQRVYEWAAVTYFAIAAAAGVWTETVTGMSAVVVAALAGAWVTRALVIAGRVLAVAAPVALALAVDIAVGNQPAEPLWLLAALTLYASAAEAVGSRLSWTVLRRSAWWLAAAVALVLADGATFTAGLGRRQLLLAVALVLLGMLGWRQHGAGLTGRLFADSRGQWLPLAIPAAACIEVAHLAERAHTLEPLTVLLVGAAEVWAIWALVTRAAERRVGANVVTSASWGIAATAAGTCALHVPVGMLVETAQWTSATALVAAAWRAPGWRGARFVTPAVFGAALLATALRTVAWVVYARPDSTWQALLEPVMQPWVSVLWALAGVAVVAAASRAAQRTPWMAGAAALALLVLKMLAVDLGNVSVLARVVAFILVGVLFLALGYLAPMPPAQESAQPDAP